ncbi:MAG: nucleotidyl transferase AbiEii/AbiGii toxin family protein [Gammaproteobacteria bacterium]|nr:nucleotidyl transferase AbiEii/AbiGii toxin family protein [Gammaproteobacteria bacterium]
MAGIPSLEHPVRLHEAPDDTYLELIQAAANHIGIPAAHVEKDYWVTRVLKRLHESDHIETVVFKGGTSLSKAHHLIERFSEDVDLALKRDESLSDSARGRLIKSIEATITRDLEYRPDHPGESKHGRIRKTPHAFPIRTDAAGLGQVSDTLLVEINSFADPEPSSEMPIATLIHDFLVTTGRPELVPLHELDPFSIHVLSVERTLCEKIMGLVRAGYEANPVQEFRRRIRHFYDLVMIMRVNRYRQFVATDAFTDLMTKVRESDRESMPDAHVWLSPSLAEAMIVADAKSLWSQVRSEFRGSFRDMVYGDSIPDDAEVLECLASIGASLTRV